MTVKKLLNLVKIKGGIVIMKFKEGNIPWNKGISFSEETRQKMSEAHKGKVNWWLNKHHSEESKRKMSESHKGLPKSEEAKRKFSKTMKGHIVSKETRRKISEANKGICPSEETKKKISEALKGENSSNWKGGITPLDKQIRTDFKYRQWRSDIFTRDEFTCQECGKVGVELHAHHIKSLSSILQKYEITTLEEAIECEELWNINNGIILCEECHKKTKNYKNKKILRKEEYCGR